MKMKKLQIALLSCTLACAFIGVNAHAKPLKHSKQNKARTTITKKTDSDSENGSFTDVSAIKLNKADFEEAFQLPIEKAAKDESEVADCTKNAGLTPCALTQAQSLVTSAEASVPSVTNAIEPTPLRIKAGERLMPTLKAWLAKNSIELVWSATSTSSGRVRDVVLDDEFEASSLDVAATLSEILEPFNFEAEIATNSGSFQRVTVRNSRNGL